jgi:hypothetical protein
MSLLDRIRNIKPQPQQKGIEKLLAAKKGKVPAVSAGPRQTALGEQAAIAATKTAMDEQTFKERLQQTRFKGQQQAAAQQHKMQKQQIAQQEELAQQRMRAQGFETSARIEAEADARRAKRRSATKINRNKINNAAEMRIRDLATTRETTLDNIFSQFESSQDELQFHKDKARIEEVSFNLMLQDKKYARELEKIGKTRNFNDRVTYQNEMNQLVFGQNLNNLLSEMGFNRTQNAKRREYQEELAKINIDMAIEVANQVANDNNTRAQIEGVARGFSTVATYAAEEWED